MGWALLVCGMGFPEPSFRTCDVPPLFFNSPYEKVLIKDSSSDYFSHRLGSWYRQTKT